MFFISHEELRIDAKIPHRLHGSPYIFRWRGGPQVAKIEGKTAAFATDLHIVFNPLPDIAWSGQGQKCSAYSQYQGYLFF